MDTTKRRRSIALFVACGGGVRIEAWLTSQRTRSWPRWTLHARTMLRHRTMALARRCRACYWSNKTICWQKNSRYDVDQSLAVLCRTSANELPCEWMREVDPRTCRPWAYLTMSSCCPCHPSMWRHGFCGVDFMIVFVRRW